MSEPNQIWLKAGSHPDDVPSLPSFHRLLGEPWLWGTDDGPGVAEGSARPRPCSGACGLADDVGLCTLMSVETRSKPAIAGRATHTHTTLSTTPQARKCRPHDSHLVGGPIHAGNGTRKLRALRARAYDWLLSSTRPGCAGDHPDAEGPSVMAELQSQGAIRPEVELSSPVICNE